MQSAHLNHEPILTCARIIWPEIRVNGKDITVDLQGLFTESYLRVHIWKVMVKSDYFHFHLTKVNIKTHNSLNILYLPALKTSCLDKFWREFSLFLIGIDNIYSYFNKSELLSTNCTIYCAIQFIIILSKVWLIVSFCHCITIHFISLLPSWDKCYL